MADNVQANAGSGGATFRTFDDGTVEWPANLAAYVVSGSPGSWVLQAVDTTHGLPVAQQGTWIVALPTGASTEATLAALNGKVTAVDTGNVTVAVSALPSGASTSSKQDTGNTSLASIDSKIVAVNTGSVTVSSSALPANAAQETGGNLASLVAKDFATQTTLALIKAKTDNLDVTLSSGSQKTQVYDPNFAQSAMVDQLRGIRIAEVNRIFGDSFADGIGSGADAGSFPVNVTATGAGSGGVTNGKLTLRTGDSASASSASLQSSKTLVFVTGAISAGQSGIQFPTTPTTWKIVSRKSGTDTQVTSFNGTSAVPDGNFHRYEIFYQGPGSAKFMVDGILMHSLSGQPSSVRTATLDFPIRYEIVNDAVNTTARYGMYDTQDGYFFEAVYTAADLSMNVRGSTAFRLGPNVNDSGYPPPLAANASKETGGNLAVLSGIMANMMDLQTQILIQLRVLNINIATGLNISDRPEQQQYDQYLLN